VAFLHRLKSYKNQVLILVSVVGHVLPFGEWIANLTTNLWLRVVDLFSFLARGDWSTAENAVLAISKNENLQSSDMP